MRIGISVFRWLGYLIIGALLGVLFSMFRSYFVVVAMIVLIILPFISVVSFLFEAKKTGVEILSHITILTEGEETDVLISSKNDGFIPLPGMDAKLEISNVFFGTSADILVSVPLRSGGDKLVLPLVVTDLGSYRLSIKDIKVSDWTGLFHVKFANEIETDPTKTVYIKALPTKSYRQTEDISGLETGAVEAEESVRKGSDTSEVNEIREYMEGDRIRDIHWKISARTDELMVKVRSSMSGTDIVVVLNFFKDADRTRHILRYSYGLLNRMLTLESGLRLLVYDASKTGFDEYVIGDESALMQAYAVILNKPLDVYTGSDVTEEALREYVNRIYPFLESYVRLNVDEKGVSADVIS